jgi:YaiO family outer membrane protein
LEGRLDHRPRTDLAVHGLIAATPEADFLPEFSIGGGVSFQAVERGAAWGPLFLFADIRHDIYPASDVTTIAPGVQYFLLDERLGISARWVHSQDDAGTSADGYVLRGDIVASDRLRFFLGYGDAPEISEGTLVDTRTVFTGASFDLNESITLNASYAHEERDAFDRDTFGLGLAVRF